MLDVLCFFCNGVLVPPPHPYIRGNPRIVSVSLTILHCCSVCVCLCLSVCVYLTHTGYLNTHSFNNMRTSFGSEVQVWAMGLVGMVWVRLRLIHYACESPHKGGSPKMCVHVCEDRKSSVIVVRQNKN